MQIIVKTREGSEIPLKCKHSDTVASVKQKLERILDVPVDSQRLIFAGKSLRDEWDLSTLSLGDGSTLHFIPKLAPSDVKLRLHLNRPGHRKLEDVYVEEDASVDDLRAKIEAFIDFEQERPRLIHRGKIIPIRDGSLKLFNLRIEEDDVIDVETISHAPYRVLILMPDDEPLSFDVVYSEPVAQLRTLAAQKYHLIASEFGLKFKGDLLPLRNALADCRVDADSILELVPSNALESDNFSVLVKLSRNRRNVHPDPFDEDLGDPYLVHTSELVASVKDKIEEDTNIPVELLELTFDDQILSDEWTLQSCRLGPGSQLLAAVLREKQITVIIQGEFSLSITLTNRSLVSDLKKTILRSRRHRSLLRVRYNGRLLRDSRSLASYHIKNEAIIDITRTNSGPHSRSDPRETASEDMRSAIDRVSHDRTNFRRTPSPLSAPGHPTPSIPLSLPDEFPPSTFISLSDSPASSFFYFPTDEVVYPNRRSRSPSVPSLSSREEKSRRRSTDIYLDRRSEDVEPRSRTFRQVSLESVEDVMPSAPHMFSRESIALSNWSRSELIRSELIRQLPACLQNDIEYSPLDHLNPCWTLTPSSKIPQSALPLTIAGAPVVIPVAYRYTLSGLIDPPPDPHPQLINPAAKLEMDTIVKIFQTFEQAEGFYLLLNGLLQVIVPEGFDYEWASSYRPNQFGGLKVCFIPQTFEPTAIRSQTAQQAERPRSSASISFVRTSRGGQPSSRHNINLKLDDKIEVRMKDSRSRGRYIGSIGVKTTFNDKVYLTMSSHVVTSAILAKAQKPFYRKWFGSSQPRLDVNWPDKVEIFAHNTRIGKIAKTFDTEATDYPEGFKHDVSLIQVANSVSHNDVESPIPDVGWISRDAWNNLRREPQNIHFLNKQSREARTIPSAEPSECMIVGTGIFLNRQRLNSAAGTSDLQTKETHVWSRFVSQCILYRVHPDWTIPGGQSGIALYAEGECEDGRHGPGIVGFQSFVQRSGHVQTFEMEQRDLGHRLRRGLVAFYGAFGVPREMRRHHVVV